MICEDAPCCGCCGPAIWRADEMAAYDAQFDLCDPYDDPNYGREDDVEYRVILVRDDYLLDVARSNWRTALGWYFNRMGMASRRRLPSMAVAVCKDGFAEMDDAFAHVHYAQAWSGCETDEPINY